MCSLKEGEDAFLRIGEALNSSSIRVSASCPNISTVRYTSNPGHDSPAHQNHTNSGKFEPHATNALTPKSQISCDANEVQLPFELISSCVATLYMIQVCF